MRLVDDPGHALWKRDFSGASGLFGLVLKACSERALAAMLDGMEWANTRLLHNRKVQHPKFDSARRSPILNNLSNGGADYSFPSNC